MAPLHVNTPPTNTSKTDFASWTQFAHHTQLFETVFTALRM